VRIGIDIDNVISNFNEMLLETYLIHDKELRNTGIINPNAKYIRTGMFDWSNEEELSFYKDNIEGIAKKLKVKEKAKEYIDRLHNDGHLIYIITGRDNGEYSEPYNMTKKWLDENNIYYDNLILTDAYDIHAKSLECLKNDIDIMIDDYEQDDGYFVKVSVDIRVIYFENNKIFPKYINDTYIMKKNNQEHLVLKDGINFIKCPSCGASIDATKGYCTYCRKEIKSLQEWIMEDN
jgi:uncharacterized HAD superfamily protein